MKAIIYAGIGLFSAAAVYGITDYYSTNKKGVVDKMYKEEEAMETKSEPAVTTVAMPVTSTTATTESKVVIAKTTNKKLVKKQKRFVRRFELGDFSRGRILPKKVIEEPEVKEVVKVAQN